MSSETILRCAHLAAGKVVEIHKTLDRALAGADDKASKERQVGGNRLPQGRRQATSEPSMPLVRFNPACLHRRPAPRRNSPQGSGVTREALARLGLCSLRS